MKITKLTINNSTTLDVSALSAKAQAELIILLTDARELGCTYEKVGDEWVDAYYAKPVEIGMRSADVFLHDDFDSAKAHLKSLVEVVNAAKTMAEAD
jgi:hypothetical protein